MRKLSYGRRWLCGLFLAIGVISVTLLLSYRLGEHQQGPDHKAVESSASEKAPAFVAPTPPYVDVGGFAQGHSAANQMPMAGREVGSDVEFRKAVSRFFAGYPHRSLSGDAVRLLESSRAMADSGDADSAFVVFQVLNGCAFGDPALVGCDAVPRDLASQRLHYLRAAAEGGSVGAQLQFSASMGEAFEDPIYLAKNLAAFERYKSESIRFLNAAASRGSADALIQLGIIYEEGIIATENLPTAFAYFWAANQTGHFRYAEARLVSLSSRMTAAQAANATEMGRRIITRCCT